MAALKEESGDAVNFSGVGGERMLEQGLTSLFPMSDLSVMGLAEVIPHLPRLVRRLIHTVSEIERINPNVVVTIDSPDFCFRVARRLRGKGITLIHYVAPTVWAWKPGRARKIAAFLDHLLALLPIEPEIFEAAGLATTFVGHPVVESGADRGDGPEFRQRHGIAAEVPLICVLPGSRHGETSRLLPIFERTVAMLRDARPELRIVVPTVGAVADEVSAAIAGWSVPAFTVQGESEKYDAFAASDAALAASGTVSLELAMARVPTVIAYRMSALTAWIARRVVRIRFASLVNIILDREIIPERLQEACSPRELANAVENLLDDKAVAHGQSDAAREALTQLGYGGPAPSQRAARTILDVVHSTRGQV